MILGPQRPIPCPEVIGLRRGCSPSLPTDGGAAIVRDIMIRIRWAREALALEPLTPRSRDSVTRCHLGPALLDFLGLVVLSHAREGDGHIEVTARGDFKIIIRIRKTRELTLHSPGKSHLYHVVLLIPVKREYPLLIG